MDKETKVFPDFKFVPGDALDSHTLYIKNRTKTKLKKKVIFWIIFSRKDHYISINIQSYLKEILSLSPERKFSWSRNVKLFQGYHWNPFSGKVETRLKYKVVWPYFLVKQKTCLVLGILGTVLNLGENCWLRHNWYIEKLLSWCGKQNYKKSLGNIWKGTFNSLSLKKKKAVLFSKCVCIIQSDNKI